MNITTKYNLGDLVKVITSDKRELIVTIDEISVITSNARTQILYYSDNYKTVELSEISGEYEEYRQAIYEDNNKDGSYDYIKCKIRVIEI